MESYSWRDIHNRLRSIGSQVPSGAACVTIHVLILDGEPVQWVVPEAYRLEPRRAARQFVDWLTGMGREDLMQIDVGDRGGG